VPGPVGDVRRFPLERRPIFAIVLVRAPGDYQPHSECDQQRRDLHEDKKLADALEPIALDAHGDLFNKPSASRNSGICCDPPKKSRAAAPIVLRGPDVDLPVHISAD